MLGMYVYVHVDIQAGRDSSPGVYAEVLRRGGVLIGLIEKERERPASPFRISNISTPPPHPC